MRIIAGLGKGTPLACPPGGVRPTADRVRAAIFSSVGDRVIGARVLDLFAGTGALGLEAASRGAGAVTLVEEARAALAAIEKNVSALRRNRAVACPVSVEARDVFGAIKHFKQHGHKFQLIFADPPYGELGRQLLADPDLPALVGTGGALVLELAVRDHVTVGAPWQLSREARYGDTQVKFLVLE